MSRRAVLVEQITDAMRMELVSIPGDSMSLSDIDRHLGELDSEFREQFAASKEDGGYLKHADIFKRITEDMATLKEKKALMLAQQEENSVASRRIRDAANIINSGAAEITEWQEDMIRQMVDTVRVLSADRIRVCLRGGMEIEQTLEGGR